MARRPGVLALSLILAFAATHAEAQNAPPGLAAAGDPAPSYLTPSPLRADNPLLTKSREYQGVALSDWMFYPEFLGEAIYNDNVATSPRPIAEPGLHLHPDLYALRDSGVSKTQVFGSADAYLYPGDPRANLYQGALGLAETYTPRADLTLKAEAEVDRLGAVLNGGSTIGPGGQTLPLIAPLQYNQAQVSFAAQKSFGRFFVGASISGVGAQYDPLATAVGSLSQSFRNSFVTTVTERGGYWLSPMIYGYVEAAENRRDYQSARLTSDGYRLTAGVGTDRLGLFRGEAFAGYQTQYYTAPLPAAVSTPVIGAKIWWYPTRALTVSVGVDQTFTDSSNPAPGDPIGNPVRDLAARGDVAYAWRHGWKASAEVRVDRAYYIGAPRMDMIYSGGARVDYEIWRNLDLSLGYTYVRVNSNTAGDSYAQDIGSLGALYKF